MLNHRFIVTICMLLVLALSTSQVAAGLDTKPTAQSGPIRGVPNDLWADIIIGKPDFGEITPYEITGSRVFNPGGVVIDRSVVPNRMYVYDGGNSRVLGMHVNTQSGRRAELVLGQPGLDGYGGCNGDGNFQHYPQRAVASAATLCSMPESQVSPREGGSFANMAVDSNGNLYVPDFDNHRVLFYTSPFETDTIADDVWGQTNFAENECNRKSQVGPGPASLCLRSITDKGFVSGVGLDSANNLWVADNQNNRVLRFPYNATTGRAGHLADLVLGQANFLTGLAGSGMNKMRAPAAVRVSTSGSVYVADSLNNRILIFNPPFSNGMSASSTLGAQLNTPTSIEFDQDNNIWVSDSGNNQLLRFTPTKVVDRVLFKDVPTYDQSCGGNYSADGPGFYFSESNLYQGPANVCDARGSLGIDSDGNIWVAGSTFLQDVRRYPAPFPPPQAGLAHAADVQVFQGYAPGDHNAITERGLSDPRGIAIGAGQLIVSDGGRVLFWNNAPESLTNGKEADGVVIAPNFNLAIDPPIGLLRIDGQNRLWVLQGDSIHVYHLPLVTGATPFYTLQPPVVVRKSLIWNPGLDIAGMVVTENGDYLWLSDPTNHRVIRIASPLTDPVVDVVLGQLNADGNQCNQGRGPSQPSANSLCFPGSVAMDGNGNLFVSDFTLEMRGNFRLLEYDAGLFPNSPASALFGINASRVYGTNKNFTISACGGTDPLCQPFEPAFNHSGQMVVGLSAYGNRHFPLVYQNPLINFLPVDTLKDYYSMPSAAYYDSADNLYVADRNRSRILIYLTDQKTISGNAGMAGITLKYNDGSAKAVVTDNSGNYTLRVSSHWNGTVTPSKPGWSFIPDHTDYVDVSSDQTAQNYAAQRSAYFISGNAKIAGATLNYKDGGPKTVVADSLGNYTILVPVGWSGTITPSKPDWSFTPADIVYANVSSDQAAQNYDAQRSAYYISGNAKIAGATLRYNNGGPRAVVADGLGNYKIWVPAGWSGTVTPSGKGANFTPPSRAYLNVSGDKAQQNFAGALPSLSFLSNGAQDGWILESGETTYRGGTMNVAATTMRLGDDANRKEYIDILSFTTSSIPDNAYIANIALKLKKHSSVGAGDPVKTLLGFQIDILPSGYGGNPDLELTDFTAAAVNTYGPYVIDPVNDVYIFNLTSGSVYINKSTRYNGVTQVRLRFKLDDNNDSVANYLNLYSGNTPVQADRPQLVINYYIP